MKMTIMKVIYCNTVLNGAKTDSKPQDNPSHKDTQFCIHSVTAYDSNLGPSKSANNYVTDHYTFSKIQGTMHVKFINAKDMLCNQYGTLVKDLKVLEEVFEKPLNSKGETNGGRSKQRVCLGGWGMGSEGMRGTRETGTAWLGILISNLKNLGMPDRLSLWEWGRNIANTCHLQVGLISLHLWQTLELQRIYWLHC